MSAGCRIAGLFERLNRDVNRNLSIATIRGSLGKSGSGKLFGLLYRWTVSDPVFEAITTCEPYASTNKVEGAARFVTGVRIGSSFSPVGSLEGLLSEYRICRSRSLLGVVV